MSVGLFPSDSYRIPQIPAQRNPLWTLMELAQDHATEPLMPYTGISSGEMPLK